MLQNVRIFSEFATPSPSVIEMVNVSSWYAKEGGYSGMVATAQYYLPTIIEKLRAMPVGERAVEMYYLLAFETYPDKGADSLAVLERGEIDTRYAIAMLKPLSKELRKRRLAIDLMYLDNEGGFGYYNLGQAGLKKIYRSARAKRHMPPEVRALNVDDFDYNSPRFLETKTIWDRYAERIKFDAIRRVLVESNLFNIKPRKSSPPVRPSIVNFWNVIPTFPIYDYNGWRLETTSIDGNSSAPSCYVGAYGGRYTGRVHHMAWNNLIGILNQVRSCMNRAGAQVHPVLANPNSCHPWLWERMVGHMVRNGVSWTGGRNAFIYWSPTNTHIEDPLAATILSRHDLNVAPVRNLPEIPLDVDVIQTGNYVTTYADFLEHAADEIPGGGG